MRNYPGRRGGAGPAGGRGTPASAGRRAWRNWAGTATATPALWRRPRDEAEISAAVKAAAAAGLQARALGSGHSFTPVAATEGLALDLSGWTGITAANPRTCTVTVRSGTTLRALNAALGELGLALANLGDIDAQTLAGALSTGTHGTGARLGGLATQVEALDLVLADGSLVTCSATTRPELFAAARVGLGALGVITTVTLRCVPSFTLAADERPVPVGEVIEQFDWLAAANDHFEFYWFPYGRKALVKRNNRLSLPGAGPEPAAGPDPAPPAGPGSPPPADSGPVPPAAARFPCRPAIPGRCRAGAGSGSSRCWRTLRSGRCAGSAAWRPSSSRRSTGSHQPRCPRGRTRTRPTGCS